MSPDTHKTRRLFFALWPDEAVREQLAASAQRWTRHPIAAANLHMTLVFLGDCSEEQRQCYCEAFAGIPLESFELQLDYLGTWARRGIQWLGCSRIPPSLPALVETCNAALAPCGFEPDKKHFVPHVTLSRKEKNPRPRAALDVILWRINEVVLVESAAVSGSVEYTVLQRWPTPQPG